MSLKRNLKLRPLNFTHVDTSGESSSKKGCCWRITRTRDPSSSERMRLQSLSKYNII